MLNRILKNHWCRLLAGNLSVALLVVGIPVWVLFAIMGTFTTVTAGVVILAMVHCALVGLQISQNGTWVPEKWLAAGYVFLPVIDVSRTVEWFSRGFWGHGLCAFVMAVAASFVTVVIVQNQWKKWREPKTPDAPVRRPMSHDHAAPDHTDDPMTMVY